MMQNLRRYQIQDIVFTISSDLPPWPSIIKAVYESYGQLNYRVSFLEDNQFMGNFVQEQLLDYWENVEFVESNYYGNQLLMKAIKLANEILKGRQNQGETCEQHLTKQSHSIFQRNMDQKSQYEDNQTKVSRNNSYSQKQYSEKQFPKKDIQKKICMDLQHGQLKTVNEKRVQTKKKSAFNRVYILKQPLREDQTYFISRKTQIRILQTLLDNLKQYIYCTQFGIQESQLFKVSNLQETEQIIILILTNNQLKLSEIIYTEILERMIDIVILTKLQPVKKITIFDQLINMISQCYKSLTKNLPSNLLTRQRVKKLIGKIDNLTSILENQ